MSAPFVWLHLNQERSQADMINSQCNSTATYWTMNTEQNSHTYPSGEIELMPDLERNHEIQELK